MKKTMLLTLILFVSIAASALASGSSAPEAGNFPNAGQDPLLVTETVKCVVVKITDDGKIVVRDVGQEEAKWLAYSKKTKFQAQDKKAFGGRKKLQAADLAVGQELKVTLRPATGEVTKVRVLKKG